MSKPVDTIKGKTLALLFVFLSIFFLVNKVREYIVMNGINQQRHFCQLFDISDRRE